MTAVVVATYSWVAPAETYHVSRDGLDGGLSRALTVVNFPIALVAIALVLIAMAVLPAVAWWAAAPAIALCATIPWFVDQDDLDARRVNAIPALGVAIALVLTVAAARRAGAAFAPRRPWDGWRIGIAACVVIVSLPWIAAELGFHFPGDVFMGEELGRETGRDADRGRPPRSPPRHGRRAARAHGAAPLARCDRAASVADRRVRVPRR